MSHSGVIFRLAIMYCFKTIEYFFDFGSKTIVYSFFQKNLKLIAFLIVCDNGVILANLTV